MNVGAIYDDNPLLASTGEHSNTSETIFPNIKIDESSSRMRWTLGYAGGLTVNQKITSQDQGSHNVLFDSQFRLSPHVNLRVAENFSLTTGFFDAGNGARSRPRPGRTERESDYSFGHAKIERNDGRDELSLCLERSDGGQRILQ